MPCVVCASCIGSDEFIPLGTCGRAFGGENEEIFLDDHAASYCRQVSLRPIASRYTPRELAIVKRKTWNELLSDCHGNPERLASASGQRR